SRGLKPIIYALNGIANGALRPFGLEPKSEAASAFTRDEVATIVSPSTRVAVLQDTTGARSATLQFTENKVIDVAIPVKNIVHLAEPVTAAMVEEAVADHGFSRYLIADGSGESHGYVHLQDVLDLTDEQFEQPVPYKRIR